MMTVLLVVAAALVLGWNEVRAYGKALLERLPRPALSWRQAAAAGLILAAIVFYHWDQEATPAPKPPAPAPAGALDLRGLFAGQHGATDAAVVAAMTAELADEIEWDGGQSEPLFASGVALDDLRRRTRELRCRGVSIGARQPAARDAIAAHLDQAVGNSGGPVDAAKRAAWVKALRDISEAADRVTR
jgi:hypothetical protein